MKNIVTVSGGTGGYTILSGLKNIPGISISAIVSMADDGGSNKILRDEFGVLPPSDVRLCLSALSDHPEVIRKLMNYRFEEGFLASHSFGNILLLALERVTGDFATGVEIASDILKVKGKVIPITKDRAHLSMLLKDGSLILGETNIDHYNFQDIGIDKIFYENNVALNESAKKALIEADYIVLGPGDYYTSIIPSLIVDGFREALLASKAKIILPVNLTNKQGHTMHWKVSNYVNVMEKYLGKIIDYILVNTETPSKEQEERYKLEEGDGVLVADDFKDSRVIREPLLSHLFFTYGKADKIRDSRSFIRHDSEKLADCIKKIIEKNN